MLLLQYQITGIAYSEVSGAIIYDSDLCRIKLDVIIKVLKSMIGFSQTIWCCIYTVYVVVCMVSHNKLLRVET